MQTLKQFPDGDVFNPQHITTIRLHSFKTSSGAVLYWVDVNFVCGSVKKFDDDITVAEVVEIIKDAPIINI